MTYGKGEESARVRTSKWAFMFFMQFCEVDDDDDELGDHNEGDGGQVDDNEGEDDHVNCVLMWNQEDEWLHGSVDDRDDHSKTLRGPAPENRRICPTNSGIAFDDSIYKVVLDMLDPILVVTLLAVIYFGNKASS